MHTRNSTGQGHWQASPSSTHRHRCSSPGMSHSPKPGLTLQGAWPGPSPLLCFSLSNESKQKMNDEVQGNGSEGPHSQNICLSAFCLTFIHSVFVFHSFICSFIQPISTLNKSLHSFQQSGCPPGILGWGCRAGEGEEGV